MDRDDQDRDEVLQEIEEMKKEVERIEKIAHPDRRDLDRLALYKETLAKIEKHKGTN